MIIQYGYNTQTADQNLKTVIYPVSFTTLGRVVISVINNYGGHVWIRLHTLQTVSKTQFTYYNERGSGVTWISIGY